MSFLSVLFLEAELPRPGQEGGRRGWGMATPLGHCCPGPPGHGNLRVTREAPEHRAGTLLPKETMKRQQPALPPRWQSSPQLHSYIPSPRSGTEAPKEATVRRCHWADQPLSPGSPRPVTLSSSRPTLHFLLLTVMTHRLLDFP